MSAAANVQVVKDFFAAMASSDKERLLTLVSIHKHSRGLQTGTSHRL
jgi:hypothetical protein